MNLFSSPVFQTNDPWDEAIFYPRAVTWKSQLHTTSEVLSQLAFQYRKMKFKIDFQDGNHGGQLGFQSERF